MNSGPVLLQGGRSIICANWEASRLQNEAQIIENLKHGNTEYGKSIMQKSTKCTKFYEREKIVIHLQVPQSYKAFKDYPW